MSPLFIDFKDTGYFSKLVTDYLESNPALTGLFSLPPDVGSFEALLKSTGSSAPDRKLLKEVVQHQYEAMYARGIDRFAAVDEHIESMDQPDSFCVTTGHQLNIFSGPLYTIYKIISTINLSEKVRQRYPEYKNYPVFWMATEDHDFAEINHFELFGNQIRWDESVSGATGRIPMKGFAPVLGRVLSSLGLHPFSDQLASLVKKAYQTGDTLAECTRILYHLLFGKYGLVVIDADNKKLKRSFSEIVRREMIERKSYPLVSAANHYLSQQGYTKQVQPRDINLFYLDDKVRERWEYRDSEYTVLNTPLRYTEASLQSLIDEHPEKFSPNVILRPLYQQYILPSLATIGGGAEVSYWLTLKSTFDHYGVVYPLLFLRNSALLVDPKSSSRLRRLGFTPEEFFKDPQVLIKKYVALHSLKSLDLEKEISALQISFNDIMQKLSAVDATLLQSMRAQESKTLHYLHEMEKKMLRSEKNGFDAQIVQIFKVKQKLFPNYGLQERSDNMIPYFLQKGPDFVDVLKNQLDPLIPKFMILDNF